MSLLVVALPDVPVTGVAIFWHPTKKVNPSASSANRFFMVDPPVFPQRAG
jgi:hypothetical protein